MVFDKSTIESDNYKFRFKNLLKEMNYSSKYMPDLKYITNNDLHFFAWMIRKAYNRLSNYSNTLEQLDKAIEEMKAKKDAYYAIDDPKSAFGLCLALDILEKHMKE